MVTEPALHQKGTWHGWALVTSLTALHAGYLAVSRDSLLSSIFIFRVFTEEQHPLFFPIPFSVVPAFQMTPPSIRHPTPSKYKYQIANHYEYVKSRPIKRKAQSIWGNPKRCCKERKSSLALLIHELSPWTPEIWRESFISFQPRNDKLGEGGRGQSWWCSYAELFDPLEWNFHICSLNVFLLSLFFPKIISLRWGMQKYDWIEIYRSGR